MRMQTCSFRVSPLSSIPKERNILTLEDKQSQCFKSIVFIVSSLLLCPTWSYLFLIFSMNLISWRVLVTHTSPIIDTLIYQKLVNNVCHTTQSSRQPLGLCQLPYKTTLLGSNNFKLAAAPSRSIKKLHLTLTTVLAVTILSFHSIYQGRTILCHPNQTESYLPNIQYCHHLKNKDRMISNLYHIWNSVIPLVYPDSIVPYQKCNINIVVKCLKLHITLIFFTTFQYPLCSYKA